MAIDPDDCPFNVRVYPFINPELWITPNGDRFWIGRATQAVTAYVDSTRTQLTPGTTYLPQTNSNTDFASFNEAYYLGQGCKPLPIISDTGYNVTEYGIGYGQDDTANFQALINKGISNYRPIYIPGNTTVNLSGPITLISGFCIVGDLRGGSIIKSTHAGPVFTTVGPATNVLEGHMSNFQLSGPGVAVAGSVGLDLAGVTTSTFSNISIGLYETGIRIRSSGVGSGGRYNRFYNILVAGGTTAYSIEGLATNANQFFGCRSGGAGTGLFVDNGTENVWWGGELEGCTVRAFHIQASAGANHCLQNGLFGVRFESNNQNWQIEDNVMDLHIIDPFLIDTPPVADVDNRVAAAASRIAIRGSLKIPQYTQAGASTALGTFRYDRSGGGVSAGPVLNVRDIGTAGSGTPIGIQTTTTRAGYLFKGLGTDGASVVFDIKSNGAIEFAEVTTPGTPPANTAMIYAKDNGSGKTQIIGRFPSGTEVVIATEA